MLLQRFGGVAALAEALIYLFGFVFFFGVLNPGVLDTPEARLNFLISKRDAYFSGYLVTGVLFSFTLLVLVQALHARLRDVMPGLMGFAAVVGYLWAAIVLASSFIFLTSLGALAELSLLDIKQALVVNHALDIVIDALGGGIELVGAVWVLAISYAGLQGNVYSRYLHYWGVLVGVAGILTTFSGLSFLEKHWLFELTTAIFGLGQIAWFIVLGILMLKDNSVGIATGERESAYS